MKVLVAQVNPVVGALEANAALIVQAVAAAARAGADVVVAPELTLTGYPPRDLLHDRGFVDRNLALAREVAAQVPAGLTCLFGYVDRDAEGSLYNAAAVARDGAIAAVARKVLLPTYDVFDEARYFRPGAEPLLVPVAGRLTGVLICEDAWNDQEFWGRTSYEREPVGELHRRGMEVLLVLSASPFSTGRIGLRVRMMQAFARRHALPCVYVNQVGGNDQLVFDGASLALDAEGGLIHLSRPFSTEHAVVDLESRGEAKVPEASDAAWAWEALVLGLRDYVGKCGFREVVLGLSGGIDSALVACVAARALGPERVHAVFMPSRFTSAESREDADAVAAGLGIHRHEVGIDGPFQALLDALAAEMKGLPFDTTEENLQARIRGTLLMAYSNKFGWLVLSTGNKSELAVGYCTLYGDMSGGLAVISDLPKRMVYEVARVASQRLGGGPGGAGPIPERVFVKAPTAELRPGQKDEDSLPPYAVLDPVLKAYVEDGLSPDAIVALGHDPATVMRIVELVDRAEYKRNQAAPGLRVTGKAFGIGRRMPIARGTWSRVAAETSPAEVVGRQRIAVFGGSFNPPHLGHEDLIERLLAADLADHVLVVPVFEHPFGKELAPFADRLELCRLAFARFAPRASVSDLEARLGGPSYTVRTLEELRRLHPGATLHLAVGADALRESPQWRDFERVRELAPPLVVPRRGEGEAGTVGVEPPRAASSTEARQRLRDGLSTEGLLNAAVAEYAVARGLYRRPEPGGGAGEGR